ncbi:MAG TPA: FAD-linked oxidase C-terminal domain-containing protein, partial [Flavitalea sp.]|nr:FAD-linked oxidase C-terminal domain-containing protein [Flavitalea sp.]
KDIFQQLMNMLSDKTNQHLIQKHFPNSSVVRRNTGYALDSMIAGRPFSSSGMPFNLCRLLAGSEGTLAIVTEARLNLIDLPPSERGVVCIHCGSLDEALRANIIALKHSPMASELVDKYIMDFTINHAEYSKNRFFIDGDPAAILIVEFMSNTLESVSEKIQKLIKEIKDAGYGYAYPILYNETSVFAWDIRKAGLGLLRNLKGDTQPVNLIEDCAVAPDELPNYIADLQQVLVKHKVNASYYAHAGAGELHVEPMINLKTAEGRITFRDILTETVELIKKYNGSLSGEHGDGRLRGEFISSVLGSEVYGLFRQVKQLFDPNNIFNAGKIVDTPPMDTYLRVQMNQLPNPASTVFNFSEQEGILRLAEKCSGSGDCRKTEITGGLMCPSYMATRKEKDTTRARANVLRQFLSNSNDKNPFDHEEIKEVMDLCLSCKGCKTECPSSVDITKMKAEFLQQYYLKNGIPFRSKMIANFSAQMKLASNMSFAYNSIFKTDWLRKKANAVVGFHPDRTIPLVAKQTLRAWFDKRKAENKSGRVVYLFCDEFTNYLDVEVGKKAILLLEALGYNVIIPKHEESGRTFLSKGLVKKAKLIANRNILLLSQLISESTPLIGIEPSAILTIRDEYLDLADEGNAARAKEVAKFTYTIEEFIADQVRQGQIVSERFTTEKQTIAVHGHCYQKVLSSQQYLNNALSVPKNYVVQMIPSGCCGMAGSFGYEKEHYDVSQKVGELVLFPTIRNLYESTIIAASGTSCRHQIKDGTQRTAFHPVEILWNALVK